MIEIDYTDFSYKVISDISRKEINKDDVYWYDEDNELVCSFEELPASCKEDPDVYKLSKTEVNRLFEDWFRKEMDAEYDK